jgi:uncharacterized protein (DUF58 family)
MGSAEQYLKPEVIQQVQRLDLKARFIVEGFISGLHDSPYHGFSVEFSEHRKYVPGDDIRMIDWNVWGKTDRYYVKKFQAETNLQCYLLVDTSSSMGFGSAGHMSKLEYAICLAAALGYMMVHQQDAVGLVGFSERVHTFLPPKSKRSHLIHLLATLARIEPRGGSDIAAALHDVATRVRKRGLVILFSDLLAEPGPVITGLHHLKFRGHDLIIFNVFDVAEVTFPFDGQVRFVDPESPLHVDTNPQSIKSAYLDQIRNFIETYRDEALGIQADFVSVDNSMTFDKALISYLINRQGRF